MSKQDHGTATIKLANERIHCGRVSRAGAAEQRAGRGGRCQTVTSDQGSRADTANRSPPVAPRTGAPQACREPSRRCRA